MPNYNEDTRQRIRMPKGNMDRVSIADLITENEEFFKAIMKAGIIDPCWQSRLEIYREFMELSDDLPVMRRYYIIANRRKISEVTVRKAVSFFVGKI